MTPEVLINNNGMILPSEQATIPAMDHGFLYGDTVYESLRTYEGRPFLLGRHLDRLQRSLEKIFLFIHRSREELEEETLRTMSAYFETYGKGNEVAVRIVISRGTGPIGLDTTLCEDPRLLVYAFGVKNLPQSYYERGIEVVISAVRRNDPRALDPGIKSGNFLNNILAYRDVRESGAQEALLLNAEGYVAEGTTSNVFLVHGGVLRTPRPFGILDGITRGVILEEARDQVPVEETDIPADHLFQADEIFITSSVRGIVPVTRINGHPVGEGVPGKWTRRIIELYKERIQRECGEKSKKA